MVAGSCRALLYPQSIVCGGAKPPLFQQQRLVLYNSSTIPALAIIRETVEGEDISFSKREIFLYAFTYSWTSRILSSTFAVLCLQINNKLWHMSTKQPWKLEVDVFCCIN